MDEQFRLGLVKYPKDAYIILMEDKRIAGQFSIILTGKVRVIREVQVAAEAHENVLGPGDFFGVVSTMSGHRHIETARAMTDVTVIVVRREQFSYLIQHNAPVANKILLEFSRRMRSLDDTLAMLTVKKTTSATADNLFDVAAYYTKQGRYYQAYYAYRQYITHCPGGKNVQAAQNKLKKIAPNIDAGKLAYETHEMTRTYAKDTMIFAQGEPGEEIFIIKSGSVKIGKVAKDSEVLLAILKTGDIFGEMALLEFKPRGASAIAYEECQLMVVNRTNFDMMIETQPQLITRLTTMLAERIWLIYKQLTNVRIKDPLRRLYDMLLIQLEKKRIDTQVRRDFLFDFGTAELFEMAGLSHGDGNMALQKLLQNKYIKIIEGKICVTNALEFSRHAAYYRKMLNAKRSRKTGIL